MLCSTTTSLRGTKDLRLRVSLSGELFQQEINIWVFYLAEPSSLRSEEASIPCSRLSRDREGTWEIASSQVKCKHALGENERSFRISLP